MMAREGKNALAAALEIATAAMALALYRYCICKHCWFIMFSLTQFDDITMTSLCCSTLFFWGEPCVYTYFPTDSRFLWLTFGVELEGDKAPHPP